MNDTADKRKNRLKALRAKGAESPNAAPVAARRGGGRRGAVGKSGGGFARGNRGAGPNFRTRILTMLKNVEKGDSVVEGTDVGQKQLEKLMNFVNGLESKGRGVKLKEKVNELLSPIESDGELQFTAEGVKKLVDFLEQGPAQRAAGRRGADRFSAGPRQGPRSRQGIAQRRRLQAQGRAGQPRKAIEELSKKADALTEDEKS